MAWDCRCEKGMRGGAYPASGRDAMGFSFCVGGLRATAVLMAGLVASGLHFGMQYLPTQAMASEAETTYAACPCNACTDEDCAWLKETTQQSEHVWLANELLYANGTMDSAYDIFLGFSEPEYQWT